MTLKISVPLHITGFFAPQFSNGPLLTGSIGAGLVITPGLRCVCKFLNKGTTKNKIIYNGVETKLKPIEKLLDLFNYNKKISIQIFSQVPMGVGYGVSGASTLAVSLALHRFLGKPDLKAAQLAHIAEVKSLTGLGDVIAVFSGSDLAIRIKAGAPGIGMVKSFKQSKKLRLVAADLRKKDTREMLKAMPLKASRFTLKILPKFIENPTLKNFFEYSQLFAKKMGFANKNFLKRLEPLKKYCLGFTVKKGVLFAVAEKNKLKETIYRLKKISPSTHIFKFGGGIKETVEKSLTKELFNAFIKIDEK